MPISSIDHTSNFPFPSRLACKLFRRSAANSIQIQHDYRAASFTGIRGEMLEAALRAHFVDGLSRRDAIQQTGVNQSLMSRKAAALQVVSDRLEKA
jgi:hypothetical protein